MGTLNTRLKIKNLQLLNLQKIFIHFLQRENFLICNLSVHSCQISHLVKFLHLKFQLLDVFENLFLLIIPFSSKFWHFHSIFTIEIRQCTLKVHQWTFIYIQERSWKFQFRAAKCTKWYFQLKMIEIEHFRSKLDVLFHVLISSFWLQTKISWFSGAVFRAFEIKFSTFFIFKTTQKIYEISNLTKYRYYWGSFYLRQITYQITVLHLIWFVEPNLQQIICLQLLVIAPNLLHPAMQTKLCAMNMGGTQILLCS